VAIPTEPIGSIPRPLALLEAIKSAGDGTAPALDAAYDKAVEDTIRQFEATGSPVITDGEQRKYQNFWTYSVEARPIRRRTDSRSHSAPGMCVGCRV
jgi:5-methyltetrahydropteroyltriglutamate--homocysteine methyltransferase